jgi:hypothetical protein
VRGYDSFAIPPIVSHYFSVLPGALTEMEASSTILWRSKSVYRFERRGRSNLYTLLLLQRIVELASISVRANK